VPEQLSRDSFAGNPHSIFFVRGAHGAAVELALIELA
jgi:hypothetical protein